MLDRDHRPQRTRGGFTLVEALVAIAILGVVALLAWRATDAMTDSETAVSAESRRWQDLDALLARMEADFREALPRVVQVGADPSATSGAAFFDPNTGVAPGWAASLDTQGDTVLAFSRAGPGAFDEPGAGGQRVGYRLDHGKLEVLYWPGLDNDRNVEPATFALALGVRRFRVLALTHAGIWSPTWPVAGEAPIPRGVRIEITQNDGSVIERILALR